MVLVDVIEWEKYLGWDIPYYFHHHKGQNDNGEEAGVGNIDWDSIAVDSDFGEVDSSKGMEADDNHLFLLDGEEEEEEEADDDMNLVVAGNKKKVEDETYAESKVDTYHMVGTSYYDDLYYYHLVVVENIDFDQALES